MSERSRRWLASSLALLAVLPLALVLLEAIAAPLSPTLAALIHGGLAPLCHQDPARSPASFGHALGACHRCIGVDLGAAMMALALARGRRATLREAMQLLAIGALDWMLGQLGLGPDLAIERLITGMVGGAGLAIAIIVTIEKSMPRLDVRRLQRWTALALSTKS